MDSLDKFLFNGHLKKLKFIFRFFFTYAPFVQSKLWVGWVLMSVITIFTTVAMLVTISTLMVSTSENLDKMFWAIIAFVAFFVSSKFRVKFKSVACDVIHELLKIKDKSSQPENISYFGEYKRRVKESKKNKSIPGSVALWEYDLISSKWLTGVVDGAIVGKIFEKNFSGLSEIAPAIGRFLLPALIYDNGHKEKDIYEKIKAIADKLPEAYRLVVKADETSLDSENNTSTDIIMLGDKKQGSYYSEFFDLQMSRVFVAIVIIPLVLAIVINLLLFPDATTLVVGGFGVGLVCSRIFKNLIDYLVNIYFSVLYLKVYHVDTLDSTQLNKLAPFLVATAGGNIDTDNEIEESDDLEEEIVDDEVGTKIVAVKTLEEIKKDRYEALSKETESDKTDFTIIDDIGDDKSPEKFEEKLSLTKRITLIGSAFERINSVYKALKINTDKGHTLDTIEKFLLKKGFTKEEFILGKEVMLEKEQSFREFEYDKGKDMTSVTDVINKKQSDVANTHQDLKNESSAERLNKLIDFIQKNLEKGNSKELIIKFLRSKKYARVRIEEAFALVSNIKKVSSNNHSKKS